MRFAVVGGLAFLVDFGVFNALHFGASIGPVTSKAVSTVVSAAVAYMGNRVWAMRHRAGEQGGRELTIFVVLNALGLAITEVFIAGDHYLIGGTSIIATNIALVVGTGVATVFRFWAYRQYVFRHPELLPDDGDERGALQAEAVVQV